MVCGTARYYRRPPNVVNRREASFAGPKIYLSDKIDDARARLGRVISIARYHDARVYQ
jgi:hypothetical protein